MYCIALPYVIPYSQYPSRVLLFCHHFNTLILSSPQPPLRYIYYIIITPYTFKLLQKKICVSLVYQHRIHHYKKKKNPSNSSLVSRYIGSASISLFSFFSIKTIFHLILKWTLFLLINHFSTIFFSMILI